MWIDLQWEKGPDLSHHSVTSLSIHSGLITDETENWVGVLQPWGLRKNKAYL